MCLAEGGGEGDGPPGVDGCGRVPFEGQEGCGAVGEVDV